MPDQPVDKMELRAALAEFRLDLNKDLELKLHPISLALDSKVTRTEHEALANRVQVLEIAQAAAAAATSAVVNWKQWVVPVFVSVMGIAVALLAIFYR